MATSLYIYPNLTENKEIYRFFKRFFLYNYKKSYNTRLSRKNGVLQLKIAKYRKLLS